MVIAAVVAAGAMLAGLLLTPVLMFASGGLLSLSGSACTTARGGKSVQPVASTSAAHSIPANYLTLFQRIGAQYSVPWVILAGIGEVESDDGRSSLPGVHNGANAFGAAGPMQIGIGGAAGNQWGGAPVHPAGEKVNGVATDADGDGVASVYDPADAIAGAAKYLLAHGVLDNVQQAIFAYNHLESYVQAVLNLAGLYARGGYSVSPVTLDSAPGCIHGAATAANNAVATAIAFAEAQIGKPYQWGGTGPDSFDCSGLVMMSYESAGVDIPRTADEQWMWGPKIQPGDEEPGDLVFFAGADGTQTDPGHVGLVIGKNEMVEAYATGFAIRISPFGTSKAAPGDEDVIGFTRPWLHVGVHIPGNNDSTD